jgi:Domain of unknown function (DUF4129)
MLVRAEPAVRTARAVAAAVVVAAGLALVAVAARSGRTAVLTPMVTYSARPVSTATGTVSPRPSPQTAAPTPASGSDWVVPGTIFVAVCLFALGYLAGFWTWLMHKSRGGRHSWWWHRPRWRPRRGQPEPEPEPLMTGELVSALDAGLRRIDEGEAEDAVVACWVLLEHAVAEAGTRRQPSETPAELTERVLAEHRVTAATLRGLADLYREARYSPHRLGEPERERARSALERVRDELAGRAAVRPGGAR